MKTEQDNIYLKRNNEICRGPKEVAEIFDEHYINVPKNIGKKLRGIEPDMKLVDGIEKSIYVKPCIQQNP